MINQRIFLTLLVLCSAFLCTGCTFGGSSTSWAYVFVSWEDHTYQTTDEYLSAVDEEIGEVTMYSDNEGTYTGNFSNEYAKGTKYYAIPGISTNEAIAVQEKDGRYRKMVIVQE